MRTPNPLAGGRGARGVVVGVLIDSSGQERSPKMGISFTPLFSPAVFSVPAH